MITSLFNDTWAFIHKEEISLDRIEEMTGVTFFGRLQLIELGTLHIDFMKELPRLLYFRNGLPNVQLLSSEWRVQRTQNTRSTETFWPIISITRFSLSSCYSFCHNSSVQMQLDNQSIPYCPLWPRRKENRFCRVCSLIGLHVADEPIAYLDSAHRIFPITGSGWVLSCIITS